MKRATANKPSALTSGVGVGHLVDEPFDDGERMAEFAKSLRIGHMAPLIRIN